ncbi:MAG: NAD-dependent deacylase [Bacteroidia bacterium]|nr:NAD-dependent deacylase [Bacteroidia bacterium]
MKRLVVLTGSGISAESGLKTFRDSGGLWEGYKIEDVASPQGFHADPERVLNFYNERRKQAMEALPNAAHEALVELEKYFQVVVITQNVDDLHERAGTQTILHLHGSLFEGRSVADPGCIVELQDDIQLGDLAPDGNQLRPNIVWFGEAVPAIEYAVQLAAIADIFLIIGTSLSVYPASSLVDFVATENPIYVVDPVIPDVKIDGNVSYLQKSATEGVPMLVAQLIEEEKEYQLNDSDES